MISNKTTLQAGTLLVSPPVQSDVNFKRAVILVCEHSEEGSFGLILNRSLALTIDQVVEEFEGHREDVRWGGPVQPKTLHFLHRVPDIIPGGIDIKPGVVWSGNFELAKVAIENKMIQPGDIRCYLGYAGWSAGQLQQEIENGGWILADSTSKSVFEIPDESLWRRTLRGLGGSYSILANYPEYPSLN